MSRFAGFPPGKTRFTPLPELLYTELLPAIDDLGELKLTLYMFWLLGRQQGYPRYMTVPELEAEDLLLASLATEGAEPVEALHRAIRQAVDRGTLLSLTVAGEDGSTEYLFLNTAQGRQAVKQVEKGELLLDHVGRVYVPYVAPPRPNIYTLYEQNIGLLSPLLAEELQAAEQAYPAEWIEDAFRIAVQENVRKWRYIAGILERWAREGKDDRPRPQPSAYDRNRRRR